MLPCAKPAKATRFDREAERRGSQLSHVCLTRLPINHICPLLDRTAVRPRLTRAKVDEPGVPTRTLMPRSLVIPPPLTTALPLRLLLLLSSSQAAAAAAGRVAPVCRRLAAPVQPFLSPSSQKAWDKNIGSSPTRGGTQLIDMALEWQKSGYRCVRISSSLCPLPAARLLASCASLPCVGRRRSESTHIRFPSVRARDEAIQAEANWPR